MSTQEQFLSKRQRYQPISLPQHFSDEEMVRDWTLSPSDIAEVEKYRKSFRLFIAIQLCAVRLYGRFLNHVHDLSPHMINYVGQQLGLPPSLAVAVPERKATYTDHRYNIMTYLGFQKFDDHAQAQLAAWIEQEARRGTLPEALFQQAETHVLAQRVLLPGPSVLERLVIHVGSNVHGELFETVFTRLSRSIEKLSRLDCRPPSSLVYTGQCDPFMPAHLRRGHGPPRTARYARRLDAASSATGHDLSARGKPRPQSPPRRSPAAPDRH